MFNVQISAEAREVILQQFSKQTFAKPGLLIQRQGPVADVKRLPDGNANWAIQRPHPWSVLVGEFATFEDDAEDVLIIDGIRVWLALVPRNGEAGVRVSVQDGELFADELSI